MAAEDTLRALFGLISEEGAFELKNLKIDPKSFPYCIQLLLLVKNYTLKSLAAQPPGVTESQTWLSKPHFHFSHTE